MIRCTKSLTVLGVSKFFCLRDERGDLDNTAKKPPPPQIPSDEPTGLRVEPW